MRALDAYRGLLANKPLTRLLAGEFVSGVGDWLYIVAILVVIFRETGDAAVLGVFGAARVVPYVLLSIPAGIAADRFDRRLILLVSDVARGLCMLGMAWLVATDGPVWGIVALAILAACGSTFFYPAIGGYIPNLARDERELGPANSAWASLDNVGFIIGPAIGGVLVAVGGVTFAFLINAATFAVIASVLWRLPPSAVAGRTAGRPGPAAVSDDTAPTSAEPTLRSAARPMSGLILVDVVAKLVFGGVGILSVILAVDTLAAGEAATGYLNAAIGVGGLVGALSSGVLVLRRRLAPPLLAGAIVLGLGSALLAGSTSLGLAMAAMAVISAGNIVLDVVLTTLLQRVTADATRGRAVGILMTASTLAEAVGSFAVPVLVVSIGLGVVLGGAAVAMVAAGILGLGLIGAAATRSPSPFEDTLARVARLPLFTGVAAPALERALGQLRSVPVSAGTVVVRQGDPADRFYIIQSGRFVVTQASEGGERRLRELGADEVFGEIGLLTGSNRTATVTALADGVLLALDGPEFLALVGGEGALRGRLLAMYAEPEAAAVA